jgi:hypothetical protein
MRPFGVQEQGVDAEVGPFGYLVGEDGVQQLHGLPAGQPQDGPVREVLPGRRLRGARRTRRRGPGAERGLNGPRGGYTRLVAGLGLSEWGGSLILHAGHCKT